MREPMFVATRALPGAELADDRVVLDRETGRYLALEGVGGSIWDRLAEPATVADLVETVTAAYTVDPAVARRDVEDFLRQLCEAGLARRVET